MESIPVLNLLTLSNLTDAGIFGALGYFYKKIVENHKDLEKTLNTVRIELPSKYVNKDELMEHLHRMEVTLNRISDKLDQKADK